MLTSQAESGFDIGRLKLYRERAKLTQAQLGERAGVHPISISTYETGKVKPYRSTAAKLEAALSACFLGGLPMGGGMFADGLRRAACPRCGAANCHALEVCIPGIEFKCVSCSRVFRLDASGRAYVPESVPGRGERPGPRMSGEARANISAGQRRRHAREREMRDE